MASMATTKPYLSNPLRRLAWLTFFYTFALLNWFLYLILGLRSGTFFHRPTEQERLRLAISRDRYWNLSKQPLPGFYHAFYTLRSGARLHYITNRTSADSARGGNLIVFLHGFPDSCIMWRSLLADPTVPVQSARIVALDLPNYGGSDTFEKCDTTILEAVTEFVVAMRDLHEQQGAGEYSTVIVAHDWGCVIGFRLAAEAPVIADRFVLSNGPHLGLSLANKDRVLATSASIYRQFRQAPIQHFHSLAKTLQALRPLLLQVLLFGYIFAFHLPSFMVKYLGTGGNRSFLRGALRSAHGRNGEEWHCEGSLASTLGPGILELETRTASNETYSTNIHLRASSESEHFWRQTAYYRDTLAFAHWEKSLSLLADLHDIDADNAISPQRRRSSSSSTALFETQYDGALKAPVTIIWGEKDLAVTRAICLDGIDDYLSRGSEVILLPRTGHWTPVEKEGRAALARVVGLCISGTGTGDTASNRNIPTYFADEVVKLYSGASSMVRK